MQEMLLNLVQQHLEPQSQHKASKPPPAPVTTPIPPTTTTTTKKTRQAEELVSCSDCGRAGLDHQETYDNPNFSQQQQVVEAGMGVGQVEETMDGDSEGSECSFKACHAQDTNLKPQPPQFISFTKIKPPPVPCETPAVTESCLGKNPMFFKCWVHDSVRVRLKGHRNVCPYNYCGCPTCSLNSDRKRLTRELRDLSERSLDLSSRPTLNLAQPALHCGPASPAAVQYPFTAWTVTDSAVYEPQHLFHLLMTGVYPTLAVTDARCEGSLAGISKKLLWSLFSLDSLNECLDADPSCEELMYQTATRHSLKRRIPVYTRAILDFSAAPLGCEPSRVTLMIENTGTVPTEWAFLFPCDLHLELQYWAETGEFDEDELHEVMDNKLFSIHPRKGTLAPGATQNVNLTYSHILSGTDRLPVLLKIARGRELLLNFICVTVEHYRRYIHFPSNKHMFTPVPVGERTSPIQMYELFNGGAMPVQYELDLTPLDIVQKVLDEVEVGRYKEHLRAWEAELERQQVEFTITEHDLKADQRAPHITSMVEIMRPRSGHLTALSYTASPSQEHLTTTEISKYRTLPPIQVMTADEGEAVRKKMRQQRKELWLKPSPPKPLLLHLGLTARTHDMQHFQEYFPHNYFFHYIKRLANEGTKGLGTQPPIPEQISCLQNQAHLITSILSNVIKSLLDDAYFVSAVKKVMAEPVPYFAQYSTRVRPPPSPSPSQATLTEDTESQAMDSNTEVSIQGSGSEKLKPAVDPVLAIEDIPQKECQILKKLSEFGNMLEQLLENMVVNIFSEALAGDFNLTARRRFLALPKYTPPLINPPSRSKSTDWTNRSHEAMTEATSKLTQDSSKATVLSPKQAASKSSAG